MQRLELPEAFDITAEATVSVARALDCRDELVIAASGVRKIDASGVQLLFAAVHAAKARGAKITWDSPAKIVIDAIRASGLDTHVNLTT
ncbi:MAG: STAS domain-containing protein [Kofleriaceae bacterium]